MWFKLVSFVLVTYQLICSNSEFIWNTVSIGGGGYVTGLYSHMDGTLYSRTDVGGMYKYDKQNEYWNQMLSFIPPENASMFGSDGIGVSPTNSNIIYGCAGKFISTTQPNYVIRSMDGGKTWKIISPNANCGSGNLPYRNSGERFAIHPNNESIVWWGSRKDPGLRMSQNYGDSWSVISSFPFNQSASMDGSDNIGIIFVSINPVSFNIYISMYNFGVYESNDNGKIWKLLSENDKISPKIACRSTFSKDGKILYVAGTDGVFSYNTSDESWLNISPLMNISYDGIDVNPSGTILIVAQQQARSPCLVWYRIIDVDNKNNFKTSWIKIPGNFNSNVPWYEGYQFSANFAAVIFDKSYQNENMNNEYTRIIACDFSSVWFNDNILDSTSIWYNTEYGHEELVVDYITSPPKTNGSTSAVLFSGVLDQQGFRHIELDKFPKSKYAQHSDPTWSQSTSGVDFCEKDPNIVVRCAGNEGGDKGKTGYISNDNGQTWKEFESQPSVNNDGYISGKIYISPSDCSHIVWIPLQQVPWVSMDSGKTWKQSSGAPSGVASNRKLHIVRDGKNGNFWYMYTSGNLYTSNNGAFNWTLTNNKLAVVGEGYIASDFSKAGKICLCLGNYGLFCSDDYGQTFIDYNSVIKSCTSVAFGVSKDSDTESLLYVFGLTISDSNNGIIYNGMYIEQDSKTFERMNNNSYALGDQSIPPIIAGDRSEYGRVYVSSSGRSIYYSTYQK